MADMAHMMITVIIPLRLRWTMDGIGSIAWMDSTHQRENMVSIVITPSIRLRKRRTMDRDLVEGFNQGSGVDKL